MSECVTINQYGDKYFVFNVKDVQRLRCDHRIIGALSGTLSQLPLQNTFYGLPLILLPEEVHVIKKHGLGTVVSKKVTRPDCYTEKKLLQFDVFEYFWKKEFYITSGIKFGGHYLLYDNEPMCTHSDYIVRVYDEKEEILPLDIISLGRVGTNVKKTFVIAGQLEEEEMMTFSIEWAGF